MVVLCWKRPTSQMSSWCIFRCKRAESNGVLRRSDLRSVGRGRGPWCRMRGDDALGRQLERVVSGIACCGFGRHVWCQTDPHAPGDIIKGTLTSPQYRSRLFVAETRFRSTVAPQDKAGVSASTPSLVALRM